MGITRSQFELQLEGLRDRLLEMGNDADSMVARSMQALMDRDALLADRVVESDDIMDTLDLEIEAECMRLLALQHPLARDLRLVGTALKVVTDLERIGDHAVDIAKVARKLARTGFYATLVDLPRMASSVRRMLNMALEAFVKHDLDLVAAVVEADDEVDLQFHTIRDELHDIMSREPKQVVQASYMLFVAHYLERMADHAVNIAERVSYVETGRLTQLAYSHKTRS
jgi:phosphate transport system protein